MTRHETRECAFYLLFEQIFQGTNSSSWDSSSSKANASGGSSSVSPHGQGIPDELETLFQTAEEADLFPVTDSVKQMVCGVLEHQSEIDAQISRYSPKRVLTRIPKVNLCILRLALYEMMYDAEMPVNAAISEAVVLASSYGYPEDRAFVNGVLGEFARAAIADKIEDEKD